MKFVSAMEQPVYRFPYQMLNQLPGKDHFDSQLIYEYIDTVSTQTRKITQSVMSALKNLQCFC